MRIANRSILKQGDHASTVRKIPFTRNLNYSVYYKNLLLGMVINENEKAW